MFWKIQFTDGIEGTGWLKFNERMEAIGLFDDDGNPVTEGVSYHPTDFNVTPPWA